MKTCFVIMPIGVDEAYRTYLNRYENLIKPAIEGLLQDDERIFDAIRADFISSTGSINRTVLRYLYQSDVVVADLTDLNPNVFYELGVRHALRHGTILVALKGTKLPFDVGEMRVVTYEDKVGAEKTTIPEIQRLLKTLLQSQADDSPIFQAVPELAVIAVRSSAEAEARITSLEFETRELRAKLAVAEHVSLNFTKSFSTFEETVRSLLGRLSPADRKNAEYEVENALITQSGKPKKRLELPNKSAEDSSAVFVLMPFRAEMVGIYEIIKRSAESLNLKVWRADDIASTGLITDQILEAISRAGIIIADITGKNPNVLYEIGMAHSLGKNVILIAEAGEILPFDIAAMRVIFYKQTIDGASKLEKGLQLSLKQVLNK